MNQIDLGEPEVAMDEDGQRQLEEGAKQGSSSFDEQRREGQNLTPLCLAEAVQVSPIPKYSAEVKYLHKILWLNMENKPKQKNNIKPQQLFFLK